MDRRQFLGAAAAVATLPEAGATAASAGEQNDTDDLGATERVGKATTSFAEVEVYDVADDGADLTIRGYHYSDEPGTVDVTTNLSGATLSFAFDPDEAEAFAERLAAAASHAREGPR